MNVDQNIFKKTISEIVEVLLRNMSADNSVNDVDKELNKVLPVIEGAKIDKSVKAHEESSDANERITIKNKSLFANNIRILRENLLLGREQLAKKAGIRVNTVRRYECQVVTETNKLHIVRIAKELGVTSAQLLNSNLKAYTEMVPYTSESKDLMITIINPKSLATSVKRLRETYGVSQEGFASMLQLPSHIINCLEKGVNKRIVAFNLNKVTKALKISPRQFLNGDLSGVKLSK